MFCTTGLVSSKQVAQMHEEEIHFGKLFLKQSETFLAQLTLATLNFDPVTQSLCYPGCVVQV